MLGGAVHPAALHPRTPVPVTDPAPLAVVLLSGGLDSMVSAALARERGFRLLALTIDYNQRHRIEIGAATRIAAELGAERHIVLRSEEHTSELQSLLRNSYAVFCLKTQQNPIQDRPINRHQLL